MSGGAARGAYWLHDALLKHGVNSKIVTNAKRISTSKDILSLTDSNFGRVLSFFIALLDFFILKLFPKRKRVIFSTGFWGLNYWSNDFYKEADIVHLHWINGVVSTKSVKTIHKPVVWTIRDMWPITGGCHYSQDCERYKIGCGKCPQLNGLFGVDFTKHSSRSKKAAFKKITPVGISDWVTNVTNASFIFGDNRAITINNNIDISRFFPVDKLTARDILGIDTQKKVILVGSTNIDDFYKGASLFFESLKSLNSDDYFICVFGSSKVDFVESYGSFLSEYGFEYKNLGYLYDDISLRLAYSSADVFVAPSVQEAFGKTLVESFACETPVVCFDATGPSSIVEHKVTGYKAEPFNPLDMANGINWIVNNNNYTYITQSARKSATEHFSSEVIAKKYIDLYKNLLSEEAE